MDSACTRAPVPRPALAAHACCTWPWLPLLSVRIFCCVSSSILFHIFFGADVLLLYKERFPIFLIVTPTQLFTERENDIEKDTCIYTHTHTRIEKERERARGKGRESLYGGSIQGDTRSQRLLLLSTSWRCCLLRDLPRKSPQP